MDDRSAVASAWRLETTALRNNSLATYYTGEQQTGTIILHLVVNAWRELEFLPLTAVTSFLWRRSPVAVTATTTIVVTVTTTIVVTSSY